jgi:hypothetical protein
MDFFQYKVSVDRIDILYCVSVEGAGLAQLVEQLICNQQVAGSSPITSSKFFEVRVLNVRTGARVAKGDGL